MQRRSTVRLQELIDKAFLTHNRNNIPRFRDLSRNLRGAIRLTIYANSGKIRTRFLFMKGFHGSRVFEYHMRGSVNI